MILARSTNRDESLCECFTTKELAEERGLTTRWIGGVEYCAEPAAVQIKFPGEGVYDLLLYNLLYMCAFHYELTRQKSEPSLVDIRKGEGKWVG